MSFPLESQLPEVKTKTPMQKTKEPSPAGTQRYKLIVGDIREIEQLVNDVVEMGFTPINGIISTPLGFAQPTIKRADTPFPPDTEYRVVFGGQQDIDSYINMAIDEGFDLLGNLYVSPYGFAQALLKPNQKDAQVMTGQRG